MKPFFFYKNPYYLMHLILGYSFVMSNNSHESFVFHEYLHIERLKEYLFSLLFKRLFNGDESWSLIENRWSGHLQNVKDQRLVVRRRPFRASLAANRCHA